MVERTRQANVIGNERLQLFDAGRELPRAERAIADGKRLRRLSPHQRAGVGAEGIEDASKLGQGTAGDHAKRGCV